MAEYLIPHDPPCWLPPFKDQGFTNQCVAFALSKPVEAVRQSMGLPYKAVSIGYTFGIDNDEDRMQLVTGEALDSLVKNGAVFSEDFEFIGANPACHNAVMLVKDNLKPFYFFENWRELKNFDDIMEYWTEYGLPIPVAVRDGEHGVVLVNYNDWGSDYFLNGKKQTSHRYELVYQDNYGATYSGDGFKTLNAVKKTKDSWRAFGLIPKKEYMHKGDVIVPNVPIDENSMPIEIVFTDVKSDQWFSEAITRQASHGTVNGYKDSTFKPDKTMSRAEVTVAIDNSERYILGRFGLSQE